MKEIFWRQVIKAASFKRMVNALKVFIALGLSSITKQSRAWGTPFIVTIEPTVLCNLCCPQCITGNGEVKRKLRSLDFDSFKSIMDQIGDRIFYLLLFNQGEPFLNPDLIKFVEIAKQKRIYVTTSTNGHFLTDEATLKKLVKSGLDTIIVSLDGTTDESYLKYRKGGNFRQVVSGIENLIEIRDRLHSKTPKVLIQCLVMKHNEDQNDQMKTLAKDLKVDRLLFKTFQIESIEGFQKFLPDNPRWHRYRLKDETFEAKNSLNRSCSRLWYSAVILSDGRVVPCCFDKNGEYSFGTITPESKIQNIWKSDAYNKFRDKILQNQESIRICYNCTANQKVYL